MRCVLHPHPDTPCPAVDAIEVSAKRTPDGQLLLLYAIAGRMDAIALPPAASPCHTDGLWRHTCLEAFLRAEDESGYGEYNLSPSRAFAAYRFDAYRAGMANASVAPPAIATRQTASCLVLRARLRPSRPDARWRLNLTAVIEAHDGTHAYWALRHGDGKPDFHHPDCFVLALAAQLNHENRS